MKGIAFDPEKVTVKKGGTVTWTNDESVPHDVTKEDGPGPDFSSGNGNLQQGDTYKQTFKEAGDGQLRLHRAPEHEGHGHRRVTPKPLSSSRAASPSPPRWGRRPSWMAPS